MYVVFKIETLAGYRPPASGPVRHRGWDVKGVRKGVRKLLRKGLTIFPPRVSHISV